MPRPPIDLPRKIKDILQHSAILPAEADFPLAHYNRSSSDVWNLLLYVERNFDQLPLYPAVVARHLGRLHNMVLVNLIETFERFLKELAACCVDHLAHYVLDDRFNAFPVHTSGLAAHFGTDTLGKSLCESTTWLNCDEINNRFRKLLADPFESDKGSFWLLPKKAGLDQSRFDTLSTIWQLRHSVVHNVGVVTQSDAIKLRLLAKEPIASPRLLSPTRDDLRYLKRFLDENADRCNQLIGQRLAVLLTKILTADPLLFEAQETANGLPTIRFVLKHR